MWEFSIDEYPKKKKKFRREHKAQNPTYAPVFKVVYKHLIWRTNQFKIFKLNLKEDGQR